MEARGQIKQILGVTDKNVNMLLTLHDIDPKAIDTLIEKDLAVTLKIYHPKRSLDSNAYAWVLISKMADVLKTSKEELYEELLRRYGVPYQDDEGYITITLKDEVDVSKVGGHWRYIRTRNGFASYLMLKGTSEYDSAEMAKFIDMLVQDAKEMGIETLTPEELERMNKEWTQYCNKTKSVGSATQPKT